MPSCHWQNIKRSSRKRTSKVNIQHQSTLEKKNFKNPLLSELQKMTSAELILLTRIPKFFKNPSQVILMQPWWRQMHYETIFWVSLCFFTFYVIILTVYLLSFYEINAILAKIHCFFIGMALWTLVEYVLHRFSFHYDLNQKRILLDHYIHHAFPNLHQKVAVSVVHTTLKLLLTSYVASYLFSQIQIAITLNGFIFTLAVYDCLHYYCHFGPQISFKILKFLKTNHLKHHYRNQDQYFGVTSTFWDLIFGTGEKQRKIRYYD